MAADNSARARHMLEVRDVDKMNARRQETRCAALSSNDFLPPGYDREAAMRTHGFLAVVHAHCLRYSKEPPPDGVLGLRNAARTGHHDQMQRKKEQADVVASISEEARLECMWLYNLGFPADLIFLFHDKPVLKYDVLTAILGVGDKVRRSDAAGKMLELSADTSAAWLSDAELAHMASMMDKVRPLPGEEPSPGGRARLAKVLMSVGRQTEVSKRKASQPEEGTLQLWVNFVEARCTGVPWVGDLGNWGWNPVIVAEKKNIKKAYARLQKADEGPVVGVKRASDILEEVRQVRLRIAEGVLAPAPSVPSVQQPPQASSSSTKPEVGQGSKAGGHNVWSKRRAEFVDILESKYPNFEMDSSFDEAGWPALVKVKDARITGFCKACRIPNGASLANIVGAQGLPKCKSIACLAASLAPSSTPTDPRDVDEAEVEAARPKLAHRSDFDEIMAFIEEYHPHVRLTADLKTRSGWENAIKNQESPIEVTCLLCGSRRKCSSQNILYNGQGFCLSCTSLETGYKRAIAIIGGLVRITNPHMRPEGSGQGQNYCHVDVECLKKGCGWKGTLCTRKYTGMLKKDPRAKIIACKRCNKVEPWGSEEGYTNFLSILEFYRETRFYKAALELPQWVQTVRNNKSIVPVQCTICDEIREVRISSIQQGGSVGCGCLRSSSILEAELAKILPNVNGCPEVKLQGGLKMDFAYFFDDDPSSNMQGYLRACSDLGVEPLSSPVKIGIELDGRQHFSWVIYSEVNEQIGLRDFKKDVFSCETGVTLIRLQQTSVWENSPDWRAFLRGALKYALSTPGGRVLCEDAPNYTHSSEYARMRASGKLSRIDRSPMLPRGIIRELM